MIQSFNHVQRIKGELDLPGDKSISHRAVIFSAMAEGISEIDNLADGEDISSTISCLEAIGAPVQRKDKSAKVLGKGFKNFHHSSLPLNAGNSGTTARLICGLLAAQNFESTIFGDQILSQRPMERVINPLKLMGANIVSTREQKLPLKIFPVEKLKPIKFDLPIPSAQVKSTVLIAGLHAEGTSIVLDRYSTRDHTERLLNLRTVQTNQAKSIYISKGNYPQPNKYFIPSDISTAAFHIVLTLLSKSSELVLKNVCINPTRTGVIKILQEMGGRIEIENEAEINNEPFADIIVKSSQLKNIEIRKETIPNIIDEIPILAIAGLFADGSFKIAHAMELRKKESNRIKSLCHNFRLLGLEVEENEDGFIVSGSLKTRFSVFESFNDHRIAMAFSVLSMLLKDGGKVNNFGCIGISNPNFISQIEKIIE